MESSQTFLSPVRQSYRFTLLVFIITLSDAVINDNLKVCKAINVFGRYGYYSVSMKVIPRFDSNEPWIFREPVVDVFQNNFETVGQTENKKGPFKGEFHMEFCDDLDQLMQAYFREYTIELMDKPWHAYTAGWSHATIERNLGIDSKYLRNSMSYVLVRILRRRECKTLKETLTSENTEPLPHVKVLSETIQVGNKTSIENFIKKYGSHYIASFSTGDALYQVFAYHPPVYRRLKGRLQKFGISSLKKSQLYTFFSPWYAEHVGTVLPASGNITLMNWAASVLTSNSHLYPYSNLMKLHGNIKKLKELEELLMNRALLSLDLKTLGPVFKDSEKREWFLEVLSNDINMWEINM